jgi:lysozyme family protein
VPFVASEYSDQTPSFPPAFLRAVATLFRHESSYSNNQADPGGETRFGISSRQYPDVDIASLTSEEATAIYYRDWWKRYDYSDLPGPIGAKIFDLAVNIGPDHAARCLQRALRACGRMLTEDGLLGSETRKAAAAANQVALIAALRSEAAAYYRILAAKSATPDDTNREFLRGWLNRAYE